MARDRNRERDVPCCSDGLGDVPSERHVGDVGCDELFEASVLFEPWT